MYLKKIKIGNVELDNNLILGADNVEKNIVTLTLSADQSIKNSDETIVAFNKYLKKGSKLEFDSSNHSIKIGTDDISRIKINMNAFAKNATTDWLWFKIFKNGVKTDFTSMVGRIGAWSSTSISPCILDVKKGDYIQLIVQYGTANSEHYIRYDGTNLTVEAV